jgi:DUF883 C-terminal glycine zipper region
VATALNEPDEIRRKMGQIRRDLHEDVREVVAGAEAATDWRRYVRAYPWAAVGAAAAVGFLAVPKVSRSAPRDAARQSDVAEVRDELRQAREEKAEAKDEKRRSLVGAAFAMAAPLAWRFAQNYAVAYLEQWIAQHQQQFMAHSGPRPVGPEAPGRPAATGQPGGPGRPRSG